MSLDLIQGEEGLAQDVKRNLYQSVTSFRILRSVFEEGLVEGAEKAHHLAPVQIDGDLRDLKPVFEEVLIEGAAESVPPRPIHQNS